LIEIRHRGIENTKASQAAYDQLYDERPIDHPASLYKWFAALAAPAPGEALLDVSCGAGGLLLVVGQSGATGHGLDISVSAVRTALSRGITLAIVGNAERLPYPDSSFHVLTNLGSLEHYNDMSAALAEAYRVVRPGGRALLLVPNSFALTHVLHVWSRGDVFDDGPPIQRYSTLEGWRSLIEQSGLRVTRVVPFELPQPGSAPEWLSMLARPRKLLRMALRHVLPASMANCLVYCCAKR
jgi:SAM-dependent methyltransferase